MADALLLRSLTAKKLNLNNKALRKVPKIIGSLTAVVDIELKNNLLTDLPDEFGNLVQVIMLFLLRSRKQ
jgi:Leucine-rich repeat (LRR) protein